MTLPLNLEASSFEPIALSFDRLADQSSERVAVVQAGLHDHFANRVVELRTSQQAAEVQFEALLEERVVAAEEFHWLSEATHEQAEEADALLMLLVRCQAPEAVINEVEEIFDTLRDMEEQVTEGLEWIKGMGRRLIKLGKSSKDQWLAY
jgi:hypothetical protein